MLKNIFILFISFNIFAGSELSIGVILKYEDNYNKTTSHLTDGITLAIKEYEKKTGLKIKINKYSYNQEMASVVKATQKAIINGEKFLIGGENSNESIIIGDLIKDKKIIFLTPTSTNPKVTKRKLNTFRTCFSDDQVVTALHNFVKSEFKNKKIGVFHNTSYPYTDFLSKKMAELLGDKTIVKEKVTRNQKDLRKIVKKFKEQNIEVVSMLTFQSDFLRFVTQASEINYHPTYIGSDGWGSNESVYKKFIKERNLDSKFKSYRNNYWNTFDQRSIVKKFKSKFKKNYSRDANAWSAIGYDTANILLASIDFKSKFKSNLNSLKKYKSESLITSKSFKFESNNSPLKELYIYKIDNNGAKLSNEVRL